MALSIKPIADRVVIEPAPAEEKTASGIYIPDTAKEKPQSGKVVAVGNGKVDEPLTVKVGDQVLYGKYAGTEITYEGKTYTLPVPAERAFSNKALEALKEIRYGLIPDSFGWNHLI